MELNYQIKGTKDTLPEGWCGAIKILRAEPLCECIVTARETTFHMILAKHCYGNYICIPDWNIGTDIAGLPDCFWNLEHLKHSYPEMSPYDLLSITYAMKALENYVYLDSER